MVAGTATPARKRKWSRTSARLYGHSTIPGQDGINNPKSAVTQPTISITKLRMDTLSKGSIKPVDSVNLESDIRTLFPNDCGSYLRWAGLSEK